MRQQDDPFLTADQQIFGAPSDIDNLAARELFGEIRRQGKTQIGPAQCHTRDSPADKARGKATADSFDFGQFRHNAL